MGNYKEFKLTKKLGEIYLLKRFKSRKVIRSISMFIILTFLASQFVNVLKSEYNVKAAEGENVSSKNSVLNSSFKKSPKVHDRELRELSTEYSTVYENTDGTRTSYTYLKPIRYKDNNGKLVEIDNSIVEETQNTDGYKYKNKSNYFNVYFPDDLISDKYIKMNYDKYSIELKNKNQNEREKLSEKKTELKYSKDNAKKINKIKYKNNLSEDIDLEYSIQDMGLKEEIILNRYTGQNSFQFYIKLTGLIPEKQEDGKILLFDKATKEIVGGIPQAFMYDSAEEENLSDEVDMSIVLINDVEDEYELTLTAAEEFLTNKSTVYPVVIDPTLTIIGTSTTYDSFVQGAYPNSNYYLSPDLRVGYDGTTGKVRSFIKFDLPSINGGMITNADFYAYENTGNTSSAYIQLHRVTGSWSSSSITWNNQPSLSSAYEPGTQIVVNGSKYYGWDITKLVSDWYRGSVSNNGFVIRDNDENARYRRFNSSDDASNKPYLKIDYSDRPTAPIATAYGNGANSKSGYVNLNWTAVSGATGYKVAIFNGIEYEYFDVGNVTSWTTQNKKIWPTVSEVAAKRYLLHHDSLGAELPDDPIETYVNSAGDYTTRHNYWFRVVSYNSYGQESDISDSVTPVIPDRTAPASITSVSVTGTNGAINSGDTASINVSWNGISDYPSGLASGVKYYEVQKIVNNGTPVAVANVTHTGTGVHSYTISNQPDNTNYKIQVRAVDNNGNYSPYTVSTQWTSLDRTAPVGPTALSLNVSSWTNVNSIILSWSGASDVGSGISSIQYKIDGGAWSSTGYATASGSKTIDTTALSNGQHSIYARVLDIAGNYTISPTSVIYYRDASKPTAAITSPAVNSFVKGTINIVGTASDDNFKSYILERSPAAGTEVWTSIGTSVSTPVTNGVLGSLNTTQIPDGGYKIRLTVRDNNNTSSALVGNIYVDNTVENDKVLITAPIVGSLVDGKVEITGFAYETNFASAKLEYGQGRTPSTWSLIKNISTPVTAASTLAVWDASLLAPGDYTIKLTVVDKTGNLAAKTVIVNIPQRLMPIGIGNDITAPVENISIGQVNIGSGNLILNDADLSIPSAKGPSINVTRTYNSQNKTLGLLGWGWSISIPKLVENPDKSVDIIEENGVRLRYTYDANNLKYIAPLGYYEKLVKNSSNNTFELNYKSGIKKIFDNVNNKIYIKDNNGFTLTYTITADKIVINDEVGRYATLSIDTFYKRISSLTDFTGRQWLYNYDKENNLKEIIGPDNIKTIYKYKNNHYIEEIITPNEIASCEKDPEYIPGKISIEYDTSNKIKQTTDRKGIITLINYDSVNNKTNFEYAYETEDATSRDLYYDSAKRLIKAVDINVKDNTASKTTIYEYGDLTNPALTTKVITAPGTQDEETQENTYDLRGNVLTSKDPSGKVTTYTYENDYIDTKTYDGKTIKNVYDSNYNLLGDDENTYIYEGGLLKEHIDKLGNYTTYLYDSMGNTYKTISSGGEEVVTLYDDLSRKKSESSQNRTVAYEYNDRNLQTKITETVEGIDKITEFIYDAEGNTTEKFMPDNVKYIYTYDVYGNVIETIAQNASGNIFIKEAAEYKGDTNQLKRHVDSEGKETKYLYNSIGNVEEATDKNGNTVIYEYDNQDRISSAQISVSNEGSSQIASNGYTYKNDKIQTIKHNNFVYSFLYDDKGNNTTIDIGNKRLITNSYNSEDKLQEAIYGNNQKIGFDYDEKYRITAKKYNDALEFEYNYYENNKLHTQKDNINDVSYNYEYDEEGRLYKITDSNNDYIQYVYRDSNILSKTSSSINNSLRTTEYTYNEVDKPKTVSFGEGTVVSFDYDSIGRLKGKTLSTGVISFTTDYSYKSGNDGATTEKVERITNNGKPIEYEYYPNWNIKKIISEGKVISYKYNELNELVREDNGVLDKTIIYNYDAGGNILEKKEYRCTTGDLGEALNTVTYSYADSNWRDKLTSFNAKEISYDEIGNPLTYDGYNFTWEAGRQLKSIVGNGKNISYKYNDAGIRTEKTVDGVLTRYYLDGDKVIFEDTVTDNIYYTYDSSDNLVSMNLNGVEYYYIRNAQNDIIGMIDKNGDLVVSYIYDSWGMLISTTGTLASTVGIINPYRYRGYRYDTETGLYYLQSRYYNPELGRFINSDAMVSGNSDLLEHNIYAYCSNNPVNRADSSGYIWETLLDIGGIGWSAYDLVTKPSWGNAGMLAWDIGATLIPFVPGSYTAKTAKITSKVVAKADNVVNALSKFVSRKMYFGNKTFLLDKSAMKHILTRHHPKYWDGSVKAAQSFLDKSMSIDEIANTIQSVMKQNRGTLIQKGTRGTYQIRGYVDGVQYVVGLKNGRVGQFYPVR